MLKLLFIATVSLTLCACFPLPEEASNSNTSQQGEQNPELNPGQDQTPAKDEPKIFSISGSIQGQSSGFEITLSVNEKFVASRQISASDTTFSFNQSVDMGDKYSVAISSPPKGQVCVVGDAKTGTIVTDVSTITIACETSDDQCAVYDPVTQATSYNNCHIWLDSQNEVRHAVNKGELSNSPTPAVPLNDLKWDEKLALVAKNYGETCPLGHNANRTSDYKTVGGSGYVGENLAWGSGTGYTKIEQAVYGWAQKEEKSYRYTEIGNGDSTDGSQVGHYTQIIWRNTTHVGCAIVTGCSKWDRTYVCNYAPGGNIRGQKPY